VGKNPFNTYDQPFNTGFEQKPKDVIASRPTVSQSDLDQQQAAGANQQTPIPVSLPPHLFYPKTAQTVDIRRLAQVSPATTTNLIVFTAPQGVRTNFMGYAVFSDAFSFDLINFVPTVNGARVFPYHGDPQANYKIGLGLAPDFSNGSLIQCQLLMNPNDVLVWQFTNNDVVAVTAGIRMVGYVDGTIVRGTPRFGG
jgi:hypothetical protein